MRNCNRRRRCSCNCRNNMMSSYNMYTQTNSRCGCMNSNNDNNNYSNPFPSNYLYGHAYTPNQTMTDTFDPQTGLENGTIFPELVSPYYPGQSMEFIDYLRNSDRRGGCGCE